MKPAEVLREALYPLTDTALLLAIIAFAALGTLAQAAGLFGLWLALVIMPAFFRYALCILEARAHGNAAPPPGIELFNWVENFWSLFPLFLLALTTWGEIFIYTRYSRAAALWLPGIFLLVYPASVAVLGTTRSPLASLNPRNLYHIMRLCGRDYLWIPLVLLVMLLAFYYLLNPGIWGIVLYFAAIYVFFLLFTLTGAVLHAHRIADEIQIDAPLAATEAHIAADLLKERRKVATHAYGFISRGNRDGGLAHIRQRLAQEADVTDAGRWFFHEMLTWETRSAALFFAQEYFAHLLSKDDDLNALKLLSRCLHEDASWKPLLRDRDAATQLAEKYKRDDLLRNLGSLKT
jgi:hypothetical protein